MSLDVQISCSAFFPGETLYIKIDVETIDEPISWIALQLQGLCGIDSARVSKHALPSVSPILDPKLVQKPASSTSFPALPIPSKGALVIQVDSSSSSLPDLSRFPDLHFCFFYTPLTILSADIPAHSTRTVRDVIRVEQHSASFSNVTVRQLMYRLELPMDLPPSFKGACVRFHYFASVAAQKNMQKIAILRFPFRVLNPIAGLKPLVFPKEPISLDAASGAIAVKEAALAEGLDDSFFEGLSERWDAIAALPLPLDRSSPCSSLSVPPTPGRRSSLPPQTPSAKSSQPQAQAAHAAPLQSAASAQGSPPRPQGTASAAAAFSSPAAGAAAAGAGSSDGVGSSSSGAQAALGLERLRSRLVYGNQLKQVKHLYRERQVPASYRLSRDSEYLCVFSLNRQAYQLGELIRGTFDFSTALCRCLQVSVWLETVEELEPPLRVQPQRGTFRKQHAEWHQYTLYASSTHFVLQLPLEGAQEFRSDLVSLRWVLRFEFLTLPSETQPRLMPVLWELPVRVVIPSCPPELTFAPQFLFPL